MLLQRNIYAFTARYLCFWPVKAQQSSSDSPTIIFLFHFSLPQKAFSNKFFSRLFARKDYACAKRSKEFCKCVSTVNKS